MALYHDGILISGANTLPQMTLAEYNALPASDRPTYWERTDLNYVNIPASDVTYGSGTVEDALDGKVSKSGDTITGTLKISNSSNTDSLLELGRSNSHGVLRLYDSGSGYRANLYTASNLTASRIFVLPNKSGTVLLDADFAPSTSATQVGQVNSPITYTATKNGWLSLVGSGGSSGKSFTVSIRDYVLSQYGVSTTVQVAANSTESLCCLQVKAGRTYYMSSSNIAFLYFIE